MAIPIAIPNPAFAGAAAAGAAASNRDLPYIDAKKTVRDLNYWINPIYWVMEGKGAPIDAYNQMASMYEMRNLVKKAQYANAILKIYDRETAKMAELGPAGYMRDRAVPVDNIGVPSLSTMPDVYVPPGIGLTYEEALAQAAKDGFLLPELLAWGKKKAAHAPMFDTMGDWSDYDSYVQQEAGGPNPENDPENDPRNPRNWKKWLGWGLGLWLGVPIGLDFVNNLVNGNFAEGGDPDWFITRNGTIMGWLNRLYRRNPGQGSTNTNTNTNTLLYYRPITDPNIVNGGTTNELDSLQYGNVTNGNSGENNYNNTIDVTPDQSVEVEYNPNTNSIYVEGDEIDLSQYEGVPTYGY